MMPGIDRRLFALRLRHGAAYLRRYPRKNAYELNTTLLLRLDWPFGIGILGNTERLPARLGIWAG